MKKIEHEFVFGVFRHFSGTNATLFNIRAFEILFNYVKSSYGPWGRAKVLRKKHTAFISKDGWYIVDHFPNFHPMVEIVKKSLKEFKKSVGDDIKTVILLTGLLLKKCEDFMMRGMDPRMLIRELNEALNIYLEYLQSLSYPLNTRSTSKELIDCALTTLYGQGIERREVVENRIDKLLENIKEYLLLTYNERRDLLRHFRIKVIPLRKGTSLESRVINGIAFKLVKDREVYDRMPSKVRNARIALLDVPLELRKLSAKMIIESENCNHLEKWMGWIWKSVTDYCDEVSRRKINVILNTRRIDDVFVHRFVEKGVIAIPNVSRKDINRIKDIVGGKVIGDLNDLSDENLGFAGVVSQEKVYDVRRFMIEKSDSKVFTILLLGSDKDLSTGMRKSIKSMLCMLKKRRYIIGGGATDVEVSMRLERKGKEGGKPKGLIMRALSSSLRELVGILIENSGLHVPSTLADIIALHANGNITAGIDVLERKVKSNVSYLKEPLYIREEAVKCAKSLLNTILSIDSVIIDERSRKEDRQR